MKSPMYIIHQYLFTIWIAFFEGYFQPGSRAQRNNNPGNLRGWSKRLPKDAQGFDRFDRPVEGWQALFRQVGLNFERNLTVREFFAGKPGVYPGYDESNPDEYARFIAGRVQLPVDNIPIITVIEEREATFNANLT